MAQKPNLPAAAYQAAPVPTHINWGYESAQYGFALGVAAFFFALISVFVFYRRGYYDLYIANKALAGASALLLALILLIGTGSRLFTYPDRFVQYRKELGILAFLLGLAHSLVSFFFLPHKFPISRFLDGVNWPFRFGLSAVILLLLIFLISNQKSTNFLGARLWWKLQYWGLRLAFILVTLHVFVMKWSGWVDWYQKGGTSDLVHPEWPGAGLLVGWFMALALLVRVSEIFGPKVAKFVWYLGFLALPVVYFYTFYRGQQIFS